MQEKARNLYHQKGGEKKQKNIMNITKKYCQKKTEINIEKYLIKEMIMK